MQKIKINNIKLFGYHGVYDEEIKDGQYFYINLMYSFDFQSNSLKDEITSVQDYTSIVQFLEKIFNKKRYNLIEKLVNDLMFHLNNEFDFEYIKLSITKNVNISCDSITVEQEVYND